MMDSLNYYHIAPTVDYHILKQPKAVLSEIEDPDPTVAYINVDAGHRNSMSLNGKKHEGSK